MKKLIVSVLVAAAAVLTFAKEYGYMIRNNGPLRVANDSNGVEWAITVPEMTKLTFATGKIEVKDLVMKDRTEKDCKFYKVSYDGKEYYAAERDVYIAKSKDEGQEGVIVDTATLFTSVRPSSFRNAVLERGTKVLVLDANSVGYGFKKVVFYDTNESTAKTRYVQAKKITSDKNDMAVLQMIEKAIAEPDEEFKKDQIKLAYNKKCSDSVHAYAEEVYNKIFGLAEYDEAETEDSDSLIGNATDTPQTFYVNSDNVNCRKAPNLEADVVRQYFSGDEVTVTRVTEEPSTIGDDTAWWYYVENTGWIFGAFLSGSIDE